MAEPTIQDAVARAKATGIDPRLIELGLRQHFGLNDDDFANIKADTPIRKALDYVARRRQSAALEIGAPTVEPIPEDRKPPVNPFATGEKTVASEWARLPQAALEVIPRAAGAVGGFINELPGSPIREMREARGESTDHIASAAHGVSQIITDRNKPGVSSAMNASNDAADAVAMPLHLLTNLLGMTPHGHESEPGIWHGVKEAFKAGEDFGGETAGGLIGGTAGLVKNLATRPLDTINALPVTTALTVAPLRGTAGASLASKGVKMGGRLGRAAELSGEFIRGTQPVKTQLESIQPKTTQEHLFQNPELIKTVDALKAEIADGTITKDVARDILESILPTRDKIISKPAPPLSKGVLVARKLGDAALSGAMGSQLAGPVGAVVGAALPESIRFAWGKLKPETQAHIRQLFLRSTEQPTPAESNRAESIVNTPHQQGAAVEAGLREAGGHIRANGMPEPDLKAVQKRDEPLTRAHAMTPEGDLQAPAFEAAGAQRKAADARELSYQQQANEKVAAELAAQATREPATEGVSAPPETQSPDDSYWQPPKIQTVIHKSADELDAMAVAERQREKNIDVEVFGEEGAKKYKIAVRQSNHPAATREQSAAAAATVKAMEDALPKAKYNLLFGIGEDGYNAAELRDIADAARNYDPNNVSDTPIYDLLSTVGREMTTGKPTIDPVSAIRLKLATQEIVRRTGQTFEDVMKDALNERIRRGHININQAQELVASTLKDLFEPLEPPKPTSVLQLPPPAKPPETLLADMAADRTKRAEAQKAQMLDAAGGRDKSGTPVGPVTNDTIDQRAGILNEPGKEKAFVSSRDARINEIAQHVNRNINEGISAESPGVVGGSETSREILEATNVNKRGSLQMYREPRWRGIVQKDILERAGLERKTPEYLNAQKQLDDMMVQIAEDSQSTKGWKNAAIELPNGQTVDLRTASNDAHAKLAVQNPALLGKITQGTLKRMGEVQNTQTRELQLANRLDAESKRFMGGKAKDNTATYDWIGPLLKGTHAGETPPLAMRANMAEIAKRMVDNPDTFATQYGVTPEHVKAIGEHLAQMEVVPVGSKLHTFMKNAVDNADIEPAGGPLHVTKSFHRTLRAEADTINSVAEVRNLWQQFQHKAKLGVTALSIPSHINNNLSSIATNTVAEGRSPLAHMAELHEFAGKVNDYYNPKAGSGLDRLERSRMRATASLGLGTDNDLQGAAAHYFKQAPGVSKIGGAYEKLAAAGGEIYTKLGDALMKGHKVYKGLVQLGGDLGALKPSEAVTLDIAPGRVIQIVKVGGDDFLIKHSNSTSAPVSLDNQQLQNLLARSVQMDANARYIGHQSPPLVVGALKKHLPSASPFFSWQYGAMDAPGKPGMLSAIMGFDGGPRYSTNSPALNALRFQRAAEVAAKRTAFNQMGMATMQENRDTAGNMVGFNPRTPHVMELAYNTRPDGKFEMVSHSFAGANPLGPSDLLWRAAASGASLFASDSMKADKGSEIGKLWRANRAGMLFAPKDALRLIGASGNLMEPIYSEIDAAERARRDVNWGPLVLKFSAQILGGSVAAVGDLTVGANDIGSDFTTRRITEGATQGSFQKEKMFDFIIRRMLGLGYQQAVIDGTAENYLLHAKNGLMGAMLGPLKKDAVRYEKTGEAAKLVRITKEMGAIGTQIDSIVAETQRDLDAAKKSTYRQAQVKPAQSNTGGSR